MPHDAIVADRMSAAQARSLTLAALIFKPIQEHKAAGG
jgi:hypothetical protein